MKTGHIHLSSHTSQHQSFMFCSCLPHTFVELVSVRQQAGAALLNLYLLMYICCLTKQQYWSNVLLWQFYHQCCLLRMCDTVRLLWVRVGSFWNWIETPLVESSLGAEGSLMLNHTHNLNYTYKKQVSLELSWVTDLHHHFEDYDLVNTLILFSIVQMRLRYPQPICAIVLV